MAIMRRSCCMRSTLSSRMTVPSVQSYPLPRLRSFRVLLRSTGQRLFTRRKSGWLFCTYARVWVHQPAYTSAVLCETSSAPPRSA
eukprot:1497831-Rhodomonas_salina.1